MDGSLFEHGKAMEDRFFVERDRQLLDQLRKEIADKENVEALASVSGISDATVLAAMVHCGVTAESMTSVSLIPLVAVAWADGSVDAAEKDAVLKATESAGIESGSASHSLVQSWLRAKPSEELLDSWKQYITGLKASLEPAAFKQLKKTVLDRARSVAEAAGGILGFGKTSGSESKVLAELEQAFE